MTADAPSASAGEFAAVTVPPEASDAKIGGKLRNFCSSNYRFEDEVSILGARPGSYYALSVRTLDSDSSSLTNTGFCPGAAILIGAISGRNKPSLVAAKALR